MMIRIATLIVLVASLSCFGKEHKLETPAGMITFLTGDKEHSQRKFFGADLWFTGEVKDDRRNVMSILYNSKDITLAREENQIVFKKHKKEMQEFAKKRSYTEVNFKDIEFKQLENKLAYHLLQWSYVKEGKKYLEESYYVECNKIFYIAKATTFYDSKSDQEKFKKIIETARCSE